MSELYVLPDGWEWKKFGELFTITSSKRVLKKDWLSDGIPFYRAREIVKLSRNGFVDNELFISEEMYNSFIDKYGIPKKNDILVTGVGTLGIAYVIKQNDKFYFKDGNIIWFKNENNTNSKYIEYGFQSEFIKNQINSNSGSTVGTYTITNANNTIIPLPPLSEQQRIVSKLDLLFEKIDKSIALHQKNMDEADLFMESVLNDVFGELNTHKTVPLKDVTTKIGSGSTPRGGQKSYKTEGISLIRSMNVHDSGFRKKGLAFIDEVQAKKLDNVTIQENDILLNITGASVARCCIVDKNYLPARVNQHVSILRLKDEMIPSFLHYYLISPSVKSELLFSSSGGATREAITKSMLEEFQVPLISLLVQEKTVAYLDEISDKVEKIKSVQKEKMDSLVALKASILDKAFRGEL